jgi:hypothetical protein
MVSLLLSAGARAVEAPDLSLGNEGELAVEGDGGDTASTEVVVVNPGYAVPVRVEFLSSTEGGAEIAHYAPKLIRAQGATVVKVTFSGLSALSKADNNGVLVIKGGATPLARQTKVTRGLHPFWDWPVIFVVGALVATLLLLLTILTGAWAYGETHLKKKAPGPKWSFSSWATTLTAVGALLSTVVAAATYPSEPAQISKDSLVALALLFGALVVVGPFVFQAIRNPKANPADQEAGLWGYSWALLLSCAITCGAVLGELGCFGLLAWELIPERGWAIIALLAILVIAGLAIFYFLVTAWSLAKTDWEKVVAKERKPPPTRVVIVGGDGAQWEYMGILGPGGGEPLNIEPGVAPKADGAGPEVPLAAPGPASWSLP